MKNIKFFFGIILLLSLTLIVSCNKNDLFKKKIDQVKTNNNPSAAHKTITMSISGKSKNVQLFGSLDIFDNLSIEYDPMYGEVIVSFQYNGYNSGVAKVELSGGGLSYNQDYTVVVSPGGNFYTAEYNLDIQPGTVLTATISMGTGGPSASVSTSIIDLNESSIEALNPINYTLSYASPAGGDYYYNFTFQWSHFNNLAGQYKQLYFLIIWWCPNSLFGNNYHTVNGSADLWSNAWGTPVSIAIPTDWFPAYYRVFVSTDPSYPMDAEQFETQVDISRLPPPTNLPELPLGMPPAEGTSGVYIDDIKNYFYANEN